MEADGEDALLGRLLAQKIELRRRLGSGAMGHVYLGHHRALDKEVAIKVLNDQSDSVGTTRFQREARAASRLDHPNAVRVLDFGEDGPDRLQYIVMERLEGTDLKAILSERKKLPSAEVVELMIPVASVLAAAHGQGFVHRDIKPANIMLHRAVGVDGVEHTVVKVLDFGLAKVWSSAAPEEITDSVAILSNDEATAVGGVVGTPAYMSPEQFRGDAVDGRSDIFSVGVVMYMALTGVRPYKGKSMRELRAERQSLVPPPPIAIDETINPALSALVMSAMAIDPEARLPSAQALWKALLEIQEAEPTLETENSGGSAQPGPETLPPPPIAAPTRRLTGLVVGAAVMASLAAAVWALMWLSPDGIAPVEELPAPEASRTVPDVAPAIPPPPSAPAPVRIAIANVPEGTEVQGLRGLVGTAPGTILLPRGSEPVVLTFRAQGFVSASKTIVPDHDQALELVLKPVAKPVGPQDRNALENPFR
ncbi:MAG: serine/threonine-protein kinase [Myxococcota bacterium]